LRLRLALPLALTVACSGGEASGPQAALLKRGQQVYAINCTACHSPEPTLAGPVGPAVAGSPLALLEAKVLRNEYPPGYTPQRDTQAMVALAHLEPDLPALAAYLAAAAKPQ
jgi:mono/diheme cytochrome c family protein